MGLWVFRAIYGLSGLPKPPEMCGFFFFDLKCVVALAYEMPMCSFNGPRDASQVKVNTA